MVPAGEIVLINQVQNTRVSPFTGEPAIKHALELLKQQRTQETLTRQFTEIQQKAAGKVQFSKAYQPKTSGASAKAPAAPAAERGGGARGEGHLRKWLPLRKQQGKDIAARPGDAMAGPSIWRPALTAFDIVSGYERGAVLGLHGAMGDAGAPEGLMMANVKAFGLGMAGALLCASSVSAQVVDWSGNLRARVTYDFNTARSTEAVAEARGLKQEDVIGDILATFDAKAPIGRQEVFARGSVGYDFHRRELAAGSRAGRRDGGVSRSIGPCGVSLAGGYARSQIDLEDLTFEATKNVYERRSVDVSLKCQRVIGIAPVFGFSQEWVENSAPTRQSSNMTSTSGTIGLMYSRPALGSISVYGEYRESDFPNRLFLVNGQIMQDGFEKTSATSATSARSAPAWMAAFSPPTPRSTRISLASMAMTA